MVKIRHWNEFEYWSGENLSIWLVGCFQVFSTVAIVDFFLQARVARLQVLRLFWCPRDLSYIYIYLSALEDHHAVHTRCIGRMHSLATTSGPASKMGVVSIFKMADLEQTLLNLSSSKIQ